MKTTVFHIITHFSLGGAENVAFNIAKSGNPQIEYHIVEVLRARGTYSESFIARMKDSGIKYHRAPGIVPDIRFHFLFERLAAAFLPFRLFVLYLLHRPQIIHSHTETADIGVYLFSKLFPHLVRKCHIVRTIHNTVLWTGQSKPGLRIEKFFNLHSTNIAISDSVKLSYENKYGKVYGTIANGAEVASTSKSLPDIDKSKINILFAGRFDRQKGINTLVKVIKSLESSRDYQFYLVGSGPLESFIQEELRMCGNVTIHPPLYGISSYFCNFDYLFMPSEFEGLSMLSIEASLSGLPVIINKCPGLKETLPQNWPLSVNDNSVEDYLKLFNFVIPSLDREKAIEESYKFGADNYSIKKMQQSYESLYHSLSHKG